MKETIGMRAGVRIVLLGSGAMTAARRLAARLSDERGAAETSTILAWIVVGVLVVFALRAGLQDAGNQVINWVKTQITRSTVAS